MSRAQAIYELGIRLAGGARLADLRERERQAKRRQRERYYAAGLTAGRRPVVRPDLVVAHRHPVGCLCHDCLFSPAAVMHPSLTRSLRGQAAAGVYISDGADASKDVGVAERD